MSNSLDNPYDKQLKSLLSAFAIAPAATANSQLIIRIAFPILFLVSLIASTGSIIIRYRNQPNSIWLFRFQPVGEARMVVPNSTLIWLLCSILSTIGAVAFLFVPSGFSASVGASAFIPLWLGGWFQIYGYLVASPTNLPTAVINSLQFIIPILLLSTIISLSTAAHFYSSSFDLIFDQLRESLLKSSKDYNMTGNTNATMDIRNAFLSTQCVYFYKSLLTWYQALWALWSFWAFFFLLSFIISSSAYFKVLSRSMEKLRAQQSLTAPKSKQLINVESTFRNLVVVSYLIGSLGILYLLANILLTFNIGNPYTPILILAIFAVVGGLTNWIILLRSIKSSNIPSPLESTSVGTETPVVNNRLVYAVELEQLKQRDDFGKLPRTEFSA